jgi:WD40 repeat protein
LAFNSVENTIKLWSILSQKEIATLRGHTKLVKCIAFSPDSKCLASASYDNTVKIWNVEL